MQFVEAFEVDQRSQRRFEVDTYFFVKLSSGGFFNCFTGLDTAPGNNEVLVTVAPPVNEKNIRPRQESDSYTLPNRHFHTTEIRRRCASVPD